jgi:hypothetical protein
MPCWEPKGPMSPSATSARPPERQYQAAVQEACDYCASPRLSWRKCKLICESCGQINKSCADL